MLWRNCFKAANGKQAAEATGEWLKTNGSGVVGGFCIVMIIFGLIGKNVAETPS